MTRRVLNLLTLLSLLLCAATVVVWVRSYRVGDNVQLRIPVDGPVVLRIHAGFGRLSFGVIRYNQRPHPRDEPTFRYTLEYPFALSDLEPRSRWRRLGFARADWSSGGQWPSRNRWLVVPTWALAATTAALPAIHGFRLSRRRRLLPGLCRSCDYNLRGNVSGVCPECGSTR